MRLMKTTGSAIQVLSMMMFAMSLGAAPPDPTSTADAQTHPPPGAVDVAKADATRNPGNALFDRTGVFVNDAGAFPAAQYKSKLKIGNVAWIALQIDNGGKIRTDNAAAIEKGWADQWRGAGLKVGFW